MYGWLPVSAATSAMAGVHVGGADRVADGLRLLGHRLVVLGVLAVELVPVGPAALVEEELRLLEVLPVARRAVELDEADLDLLVARHRAAPLQIEHRADQVGVLDRHVQQRPLARGLEVRDGGLVEVAGVVELVALLLVDPARPSPPSASPWPDRSCAPCRDSRRAPGPSRSSRSARRRRPPAAGPCFVASA